MFGRSLLIRFIAAILAATPALAPGVASIVDARPAARSESVQLAPHADVPGTKHGVTHPDRCALCGVSSRMYDTPPPVASRPVVLVVEWPTRISRVAAHEGAGRWSPPPRAPPRA
ncbi:MAG: hypothetical protein ABIT38_13155 [Gemmatimonadaceae bacterium]